MVCNRVGFVALLAQAIYELPSPDARLLDEAERLCAFLRGQCRTDGSVHYTDNPADEPLKLDPAGANEYPGEALLAIATGNRVRPAAWKMEVAARGVTYYRARFKANPNAALAATLSPACAELFRQAKSAGAAAALFEMTDWLCTQQIAANDPRTPQWAGGFRTAADGSPPGAEVGLFLRGLACAYEVNRHVPDLAREARYKAAILDAARFVCSLQYLEANTRHFENTFRANMLVGGFHLSPADGHLRVDATAAAVSGLIAFLSSGAER
jgi:hypothetical protein